MEFRQIQPLYISGATWFGLSLDSLYSDEFDRNALKQWVDKISSCFRATFNNPETGDEITFKELFYYDLLNFCVYVALADGEISDKEVEEIRWLLSGNDEAPFDYGRDWMEDIANFIYEYKWMDVYPRSFQMLISAFGKDGGAELELEALGQFANFYRQIARYIYSLDNDEDFDENETLKEYTDAFKKYIERVSVIDFSIPDDEETIEKVCAAWEDLVEARANLVSCPECGEYISGLAESCPKCGFPFALYQSSNSCEGDPYQRVASSVYAPSLLLSILSQNEDWEIRAAVAKNPSTPTELLWSLSDDDDEDVRAAVAENINAPIPILERLAGDAAVEVANAVVGNPGVPEFIQAVAEDRIASAGHGDEDPDDAYLGTDDDWYDDPAEHDDLPTGYYNSRSGDFYVDDYGRRCEVIDGTEYGGMRMYYDEDNSCWLEC